MITLDELITDETKVNVVRKKNDAISLADNGTTIYTKIFNVNEFIGQRLGRIRNVRTNKYFLAAYGNRCRITKYKSLDTNPDDIMIGSYDFTKRDCCYIHLSEFGYGMNSLFKVLDNCPGEENREELTREILEMFALDTFIGQEDRGGQNFLFECDRDYNLHLAPIYDFEMSFDVVDDNDIYQNPLFNLANFKEYKELFRQFPEFREMLGSYIGVDLEREIRKTFRDRQFSLDADISDYRKFSVEKQKQLVRLLN